MRRFVDLHTHSTASDGGISPEELVVQADRLDLAALALTDHDTTAGLAAAQGAAERTPELRFVPGIEVSARFVGGTMHILGLGIDASSPAMEELTRRLRADREERNPKIIEKLRHLGIEITMEDVLAAAGRPAGNRPGTITSRVHMAEALRRKGVVRTAQEAFDRYLGAGAKAYVEKDRMAPSDVIGAVHDSGGLAILAHPVQLNCANTAQLERVVRELSHAGLDGIEAYHSAHSDRQTRLYRDLAERFGLAVVGGSDFHGSARPEAVLGRPRVPVAAVTGAAARRFLRGA